MQSEVATFDDARFDEHVLASGKPVLVDFWAPWCGPCRMLGPIIDELAAEFTGRVVVGKLNVDENSLTARRFGVRSIPTLILFREGVAVERIVGVEPKPRLLEALERAIAGTTDPA